MNSIRACLLVGAMLVIAGAATAMEAMSNADMADSTGQAGITMNVILPDLDGAGPGTDLGLVVGSIALHDSNGFSGASSAGAIQLGSNVVGDMFQIIHPSRGFTSYKIDAAGDANNNGISNDPLLNIKITSPATILKTGNIYVAASAGVSAPTTSLTKIMDSMTITSSGGISNVQLGNESQGAMIVSSSTSLGGLNITPFVVYDVNSGGAFRIDNINIVNRAGTNFDLRTSWDIAATGLVVTVDQFGSVAGGADVKMTNLRFGDLSTTAIGNVELIGLTLAGAAIRITGKL